MTSSDGDQVRALSMVVAFFFPLHSFKNGVLLTALTWVFCVFELFIYFFCIFPRRPR